MSHHHRIIRFDMAADAVCPLGYQWERTATGVSLALDDKDADTMRNALAEREAERKRRALSERDWWTERDVTDEYFIGRTTVECMAHSPGLGTIDLEGNAESSIVAVPRENFERVLCTLHDFEPLKKLGASFVVDTMATLAARIDAHVTACKEQGVVALLDGAEVSRLMQAILNRDVLHASNLSAPAVRAVALKAGQPWAVWSPDVHWPATGTESQPGRYLARGAEEDEDDDAEIGALGPWVAGTFATMKEAAESFLADPCAFKVCIVRSATQETVFVRTATGVETQEEWCFERGGLLLCPKPQLPGDDHYFVETSYESAVEQPGHPAACRGVDAWLVCHHCDAWADYNYGDGIDDAVCDAFGMVSP